MNNDGQFVFKNEKTNKFPIYEVQVYIPEGELKANPDIGPYHGNKESAFFDYQPTVEQFLLALEKHHKEYIAHKKELTVGDDNKEEEEKNAKRFKQLAARMELFYGVLRQLDRMPTISNDRIGSSSTSVGSNEDVTIDKKVYTRHLPSVSISRIWVNTGTVNEEVRNERKTLKDVSRIAEARKAYAKYIEADDRQF